MLKQYQMIQKENEQLTQTVKELKIIQEENLLRISQMEQQAGILKSAAGKMNEKDKKFGGLRPHIFKKKGGGFAEFLVP
jgi:uncharacterized membrane protein YqiK